MENEQATIDLLTSLTGRQTVLQFHLGNVPIVNLSWSELDEKQKDTILNAGHMFGLDRSRVPDPTSFSK